MQHLERVSRAAVACALVLALPVVACLSVDAPAQIPSLGSGDTWSVFHTKLNGLGYTNIDQVNLDWVSINLPTTDNETVVERVWPPPGTDYPTSDPVLVVMRRVQVPVPGDETQLGFYDGLLAAKGLNFHEIINDDSGMTMPGPRSKSIWWLLYVVKTDPEPLPSDLRVGESISVFVSATPRTSEGAGPSGPETRTTPEKNGSPDPDPCDNTLPVILGVLLAIAVIIIIVLLRRKP